MTIIYKPFKNIYEETDSTYERTTESYVCL